MGFWMWNSGCRILVCGIFATLRNFFSAATVRHDLFVRMSPCGNKWGCFMKSSVIKRSVVLAGHKTSVSLEDAFWRGLKEIAAGRHITLSDLVSSIDCERERGNLSSAIRLFVLDAHRRRLAELKEGLGGTRQLTDLGEGHGHPMAELSVLAYS